MNMDCTEGPETLPTRKEGAGTSEVSSDEERRLLEMDLEPPKPQRMDLEPPKPQRPPKIPRTRGTQPPKTVTTPSYAQVVQQVEKPNSRGESTMMVFSKGALPTRIQTETEEMEAFDSHFHLDRLLHEERQATGLSVEEAIKLPVGRSPTYPVTVVGGVINYCDPENLGKVSYPTNPKWRIAVGVHPKKVGKMTPEKWVELERQIHSSRVIGISEVGLDYSVPKENWTRQVDALERILKMGATGLVLIVHLRGEKGDPLGLAVHKRCRQMFQKHCSKFQRIHLHTFCSNYEVAKEWMNAFPNCYFGFSGKVARFNADQKEAVRKIFLNKILVETDSPHLAIAS